MTFYSQRNPLWGFNIMGSTNRRINQDGCTISCLGMAADANPGDVNKLLTENKGYAPKTNLVSWAAACKALQRLKFIYRYTSYNNKTALDAIAKYGFVLAEVDFDGNPKTTGKHWIVLLGNKKMYDPWSLIGRTEPTTKYTNYTGLAVIQRI